MDFPWIDYLLTFLGIVLAVVLAVFFNAIKQLLSIRIHHPKYHLKNGSEMPPYLKQVYGAAIKELTPLGFKLHHYQVSQDMGAKTGAQRWSLVLNNPDDYVYAEISPACTLLDMPGYEIDFWSIGPDGNALLSRNGRGHMVFAEMPGVMIHDPMAMTISQQYRSHLEERRNWSSSRFFQTLDPQSYIKMQQKLMDDYFNNLGQTQGMIPTGKDQYRLTIHKCMQHVFKILKAEHKIKVLARIKHKINVKQRKKALKEGLPDPQPVMPVEAEMMAYQRLNSNAIRLFNPVITAVLLSLFAVSLAVSYFVLDMNFSYHSIFLVFAALILHECGHALAMVNFKYWDPQVFFLPIPTKKNQKTNSISTSKQVLVFLMGPLPGITAGIILLVLNKSMQQPLLYEFAIILLVINYLNLLPFKPLDGGYIVRLAIRERYFTVKFLLTVAGSTAFGAVAYYMDIWIFYGLAGILVVSLPFGLRDSSVLRRLYKKTKQLQKEKGQSTDFHALNWNHKLAWAFQTLKEKKYNRIDFFTKFKMINSVKQVMLQPARAGIISSAGLLSLYLGIMAMIPTAIIVTGVKMEISSELIARVDNRFYGNVRQISKKNKVTKQQLFDTLISKIDRDIENGDLKTVKTSLAEAQELSNKLDSDSSRARYHRFASAYYLKKNKVSRSEQELLKAIELFKLQTSDENYVQLAHCYKLMSDIRQEQFDTKAIDITLQQAVGMALKVKDEKHWKIIPEMVGYLLDWYFSQNLRKQAEKTLLTLKDKVTDRNAPLKKYVNKFVYEELGWFYADKGNATIAMEQFDQAMALVETGDQEKETTNTNNKKQVMEETKILLAKAAVYHNRGYKSFSRMSLTDAESRIKQHDFISLKDYIEELRPEAQPDNRTIDRKNRQVVRWRMINSAYNDANLFK